jgi:hypothetical protein
VDCISPTEYTFNSHHLSVPITTFEVSEAIQSLKKKKASDGSGLTAEHLQMAVEPVSKFLTPVINEIVATGHIPDSLKEGIIHPVHKKNKDKSLPGNYRGITVSPVIGKLMDKIFLLHQQISTPLREHPLQFGFTAKRSGTHAAFILNECVAECQDRGVPLFVASLDVQKAFDVVRHESLLDKLFQQGLLGKWWCLKEDSYRNLKGKVLWEGNESKLFNIKQGNRQGGLSSPDDYKSYIVDLLNNLSRTNAGFYIGSINVCAPTCADDMLVLSSNMFELQLLLLMVAAYANSEHYIIHPDKSMILPLNISSNHEQQNLVELKPWSINDRCLPVKTELTHVGIARNIKGITPTVESRISLGRRTLYAMMGSGLHGLNGLPVPTSVHLYNIYIMPRATYGLEVLSLKGAHLTSLTLFHRSTLRSILGIPDRTAIPALHILTGVLPMKAILDIKTLCFLHSLIDTGGTTRDIILRQYATKKNTSKSWVIYVKKLLQLYSLPTIYDIFTDAPTKQQWKKTVKHAVISETEKVLENDCLGNSTLHYLNPQFQHSLPHQAVLSVSNPREVTRSNIKLRLLSGTYTLESSQKTFKRSSSDTCTLCGFEQEDTTHFILNCQALRNITDHYLLQIQNCIPYVFQLRETILRDHKLLTRLILDSTHPLIADPLPLSKESREHLECITRSLCFALHTKRSIIIGPNKK